MTRVAAVDCGTNSIRLLIAEVDPATGALVDLDRRMQIVRLGQGVDATGRLAEEALARTFAVARDYAAAIERRAVTRTRFVATSATRDAANTEDFTAGVREIFGLDPEVISGEEEAALTFAGATDSLLDDPEVPPPYLVVDIGGGSTEFVLGARAESGSRNGAARGPAAVLGARSVDVGCVRLLERHLRSDPPTGAEVAAATADIDAAIDGVAASVPLGRARSLVGVAGSVTTVAAIAMDLPAYDPARIHHSRIATGRVREVAADLLARSSAQRATIPALHPGRVDVIAAGALILERVGVRLGLGEVVVSEKDILDGIAASLL